MISIEPSREDSHGNVFSPTPDENLASVCILTDAECAWVTIPVIRMRLARRHGYMEATLHPPRKGDARGRRVPTKYLKPRKHSGVYRLSRKDRG